MKRAGNRIGTSTVRQVQIRPERGRGTIDWVQVRERLAQAQAGAATTDDLTPERARAVMDERARLLARPPAPVLAGHTLDVLTFALGRERYGLETKYVREVVRLVALTSVPGVAEFVLGVTNLRGDILCVVDARKFFGVASAGLTDLSRIIVVGRDTAEFGLLADRTDEIMGLRADELLPPPESVAGIGREYLRGVTRDALIVLEGAALVADPRLFVDQRETGTN